MSCFFFKVPIISNPTHGKFCSSRYWTWLKSKGSNICVIHELAIGQIEHFIDHTKYRVCLIPKNSWCYDYWMYQMMMAKETATQPGRFLPEIIGELIESNFAVLPFHDQPLQFLLNVLARHAGERSWLRCRPPTHRLPRRQPQPDAEAEPNSQRRHDDMFLLHLVTPRNLRKPSRSLSSSLNFSPATTKTTYKS